MTAVAAADPATHTVRILLLDGLEEDICFPGEYRVF
jgi:hypothetical protein